MKIHSSIRTILLAGALVSAAGTAEASSLMRILFPPVAPPAAATPAPAPAPVPQAAAMQVAPNPATAKVIPPVLVRYDTDEKPGTIIVHFDEKYLYLVKGDGTAIRYAVGVGRDGFGWRGSVKVGRKAKWPEWNAPAEMIARRPDMPRHMKGGPGNPLGARAMYLYDAGQDTMFRIHGTSEPWTIGHNVSSGCIRMYNADVSDLYERISIGTKVIVR